MDLTLNKPRRLICPEIKGISAKVSVIAQLEFEISYYDVTVQHFSYEYFPYTYFVSPLNKYTRINL